MEWTMEFFPTKEGASHTVFYLLSSHPFENTPLGTVSRISFQLLPSLVLRPFWEGETVWQLPRVQTVYGRNVTAIAYLIQAVKST